MEEDQSEEQLDISESESQPLPPLRLSETEKQVLQLYDRLEELDLEISLLRAQELEEDGPAVVTEADLDKARQDLLHAKARYTLRRNIVENVLLANPILKAVHAGTNAEPTEQELLPLIQERDALSMSLSGKSQRLTNLKNELTTTEVEHTRQARQNKELAQRVLGLAKQLEESEQQTIADEDGSEQIAALKEEVRTSRQRWRIMKGAVGGIVVGSGIDWASDPELAELVMEIDSDEG